MTSARLSPPTSRGQSARRSSFTASRQALPIDVAQQNTLRIKVRQARFDNTIVAVLSVSMFGVGFFDLSYYIEGRHKGGWSATTTFWSPAFRSKNKSLHSRGDYEVRQLAEDFLGPLDFKRAQPNALEEVDWPPASCRREG